LENKIICTADNKPYLCKQLLLHFDQIIAVCQQTNEETAARSHTMECTNNQKMAAQLIPQSISIALSIRELIKQGYLFGAHVLKRSLIERIMNLIYIHTFPEKGHEGWHYSNAPSLATMLEEINNEAHDIDIKGDPFTASINALAHGNPDSGPWNAITMANDEGGQTPYKILCLPVLCDELCADILPWLALLPSMINAYSHDQEA